MRWKERIGWTAQAAAVLIVGCLLTSGCSSSHESSAPANGQAATEPGEENSPRGVFLRARAAAAKQDWDQFCSCLTPSAQDTLAASLAVAGNMLRNMAAMADRAQDDAIAKRLHEQADPVIAVLKKYKIRENLIAGVDPQLLQQEEPPRELVDQIVSGIENRNGFVAEMLAAMVAAQGGRPAVALGGELEDVSIDGDQAEGFLVGTKNGKPSRDPIPFRKINGQWKLEFTLE